MEKKASVIDLLKSSSRRQKIGFTDLEILFLVDKSDRAIQREITNLWKDEKIEELLLTIDNKNYLILYRLLDKH